jgi:hypothetical protein
MKTLALLCTEFTPPTLRLHYASQNSASHVSSHCELFLLAFLRPAGAHLLDQALTLFGPPSALTARVLNQRQLPQSNAADAFTITLHYEPPSRHAHLTVILRASMLAKRAGPRFLLHGNLGSFEKAGLDVQEAQLRAGMAPTDPGELVLSWYLYSTRASYSCRLHTLYIIV